MRSVLFAIAGSVLLGALAVRAEGENGTTEAVYWTPIQLSLATPMQIAPKAWDVKGLRLGIIYSDNRDVGFIDVTGLVNRTTGDETGIQIGGILNRVEGNVSGIQIAGIVNSVGSNSLVEGAQIACMNMAGDVSGVQIGAINQAGTMQGVQIGVINVTRELSGLQIGLININKSGEIPFLPIVNFGF